MNLPDIIRENGNWGSLRLLRGYFRKSGPTLFNFKREDLAKYYFPRTSEERQKNLSFTLNYIALAAKLMVADSPLNDNEISCLVASFKVSAIHCNKIKEMALLAANDNLDIETHIRQIVSLFPVNSPVYSELGYALIKIAAIDGPINIAEMSLLKIYAGHLKISAGAFSQLFEKFVYNEILGLKNGSQLPIEPGEIRKLYKLAARTCHPDALANYSDIAGEYRQALQETFIKIGNLYFSLKS